jgi:hypothetical protein
MPAPLRCLSAMSSRNIAGAIAAGLLFTVIITGFPPAVSAEEPAANAEPSTAAATPEPKLWRVTLVEARSKTPLKGVTVAVKVKKHPDEPSQSIELTSDDSGNIEIPLLPGEVTTVHSASPKWWTYRWPIVGGFIEDKDGAVAGGNDDERRKIRLWRGTNVTGKLLTPTGEPAAAIRLNVGVYIYNESPFKEGDDSPKIYNSWDRGQWPNWHASVVTRDDGSFSIAVPPSDVRHWVRIGTTGLGFEAIKTSHLQEKDKTHPLVRYAPFEVEANGRKDSLRINESAGVLDFGTLQFREGVILKGTVVDSHGVPLAGVHLTTSNRHGPHAGRTATSAADGSYEFAPMSPGTFTMSIDARRRNAEGEVDSRDVQAVFVNQKITLPESSETIERTIQAEPHVEVEFEWIDRRAAKGPVSYYGEFSVSGQILSGEAKPTYWNGATNLIARDGKLFLVAKIPASLTQVNLALHADSRVTPSYKDDVINAGPGNIDLSNFATPMRRVIYGDEPLVENALPSRLSD